MPGHADRRPRPRSESSDRAANAASGSTDVRIVDHAETVAGPRRGDAEGTRAAAFARFGSKARRLPTFARTYSSHDASAHGSPNKALGRIMRSLDGKFVVANRPCSATL